MMFKNVIAVVCGAVYEVVISECYPSQNLYYFIDSNGRKARIHHDGLIGNVQYLNEFSTGDTILVWTSHTVMDTDAGIKNATSYYSVYRPK